MRKSPTFTNNNWRKSDDLNFAQPKTHSGEILLEEYHNPTGRIQLPLADAIHIPTQGVNDLVNSRRGVTPSTALRLAKFFGMSTDFWMNLQLRWDIYFARQDEAAALNKIQPFDTRVG